MYIYMYIEFCFSTWRGQALLNSRTTKGPSWGYPRGRFWDLGTVLEPFCGELFPQVDKPVKNRLVKYPHEGPCVGAPLSLNFEILVWDLVKRWSKMARRRSIKSGSP